MLGWKDVSNYKFTVITLFEAIQLEWLINWKNHDEISVLMRQYPDVAWYMKHKAPHLKDEFEKIEKIETDLAYTEDLEKKFVSSLEDWIIYVTDPDCYDRQDHNKWDTNELLSIIDFTDKTVIDIGSGTGSQVFRVAALAKTVFAVEPVGNLRAYIKNKAKKLGFDNVYPVDGIMTELPYPDDFCDVVMAGHVFGDYIEDELKEMKRVVKQDGMIILIPGNNDEDNDTHKFLINNGFEYSSFLEPRDGMKRKYWKVK